MLRLKDKSGKVISSNFYWRGNNRRDFTALNRLPKVTPSVTWKVRKNGGRCFIDAKIANSSSAVAFGIRVQAVKASTGEQILPSITNDNYFSLLPGEDKEIHFEFDAGILGSDAPRVIAEAYNQ